MSTTVIVTTEQLARAFAASVLNDLRDNADGRKLLRDNPVSNPYCESHVYLDANMNMLWAYERLSGRSYNDNDFELNDLTDLFNEAWDLTRAKNWFVDWSDL